MVQLITSCKKVEVIEAYHLAHCDVVGGRGVLLNVEQLFTEIPIVGLAQVRISDKWDNGEHVFRTEMEARLYDVFREEGKRYAFRLTTASGAQFLIGLGWEPYPLPLCDENAPSAVTDKHTPHLKVVWNAPVPWLSILD